MRAYSRAVVCSSSSRCTSKGSAMRPMRMYNASCGTEMSEAVVAHVSAADTAAEKENCVVGEGGSGGGGKWSAASRRR